MGVIQEDKIELVSDQGGIAKSRSAHMIQIAPLVIIGGDTPALGGKVENGYRFEALPMVVFLDCFLNDVDQPILDNCIRCVYGLGRFRGVLQFDDIPHQKDCGHGKKRESTLQPKSVECQGLRME